MRKSTSAELENLRIANASTLAAMQREVDVTKALLESTTRKLQKSQTSLRTQERKQVQKRKKRLGGGRGGSRGGEGAREGE